MRFLIILTMLTGLAGCGADGEPEKPTANVGVMVTPNGVRASTSVGVKVGGVNLGIGVGF